ncbi:MAG: ABC transporter ATP-binding protein [Pseudomonadota bacterium]
MTLPEREAALEVEGVSHSFGQRRALDQVSLTIQPGSFTVLLGQNGAGKTTLFSLITRLYNNRSGSIRVYGFDVRDQASEALARIGVVFQQRTLDLDLTVRQNLLYHAALHGIASGKAKERLEEELNRLGLSERAGDKVRQLSGGQLRRVEIARALLHQPRLLLLDEPTVGLDIGSRRDILEHVRQLAGVGDLGLLWATHLIDEVAPGNQVVVLHKGQVRGIGERDALVAQTGASDLADAFHRLTEDKAA